MEIVNAEALLGVDLEIFKEYLVSPLKDAVFLY